MKRKTMPLGIGAVILVACNSLLGNDRVSAWNPDASGVDAAESDGSGSSGAVGGDARGDSNMSDGGSGSGGDAGADATDADDAAAPCDAGGVASDPHNCGACGHDCLGGSCSAGVCGPVTLATGQADPSWLAVNGGRVFWYNVHPGGGSPALWAVGVDGGNPRQEFTGQGNAQVISAGSSIYVGNGPFPDAVTGVNPTSNMLTHFGSSASVYGGVAANDDAGVVYWMNCGYPNDGARYVTVFSASANSQTTLATDINSAFGHSSGCPMYGIVFVDGYLFYQSASNEVVRIPATGCPDAGSCATKVTNSPGTTGGGTIVSDGTYVYWSELPNSNQGSILRQDIALSEQAIVVQTNIGGSYQINLAVDGTYVYWNDNFADGGIGYARKDGTDFGLPETRLASGQTWPWGVATDSSNVYWSNQGTGDAYNHLNSDGTVMRAAKP